MSQNIITVADRHQAAKILQEHHQSITVLVGGVSYTYIFNFAGEVVDHNDPDRVALLEAVNNWRTWQAGYYTLPTDEKPITRIINFRAHSFAIQNVNVGDWATYMDYQTEVEHVAIIRGIYYVHPVENVFFEVGFPDSLPISDVICRDDIINVTWDTRFKFQAGDVLRYGPRQWVLLTHVNDEKNDAGFQPINKDGTHKKAGRYYTYGSTGPIYGRGFEKIAYRDGVPVYPDHIEEPSPQRKIR